MEIIYRDHFRAANAKEMERIVEQHNISEQIEKLSGGVKGVEISSRRNGPELAVFFRLTVGHGALLDTVIREMLPALRAITGELLKPVGCRLSLSAQIDAQQAEQALQEFSAVSAPSLIFFTFPEADSLAGIRLRQRSHDRGYWYLIDLPFISDIPDVLNAVLLLAGSLKKVLQDVVEGVRPTERLYAFPQLLSTSA